MDKNYKLILGDCLEKLKDIEDKSIDMILCDLPYGSTACKWDVIIPFDTLWEQYNRIIKDNGAVVLFGSEPFSSFLRTSNIKNYKYDWIWKKTKAGNFALCKKNPMKYHENISVFYKKFPTYNLWKLKKLDKPVNSSRKNKGSNLGHCSDKGNYKQEYTGYHNSILEFSNKSGKGYSFHPTQKPIDLLEYLIKTYTNENEIVLDNCMGSGSTGIACINANRKFIGIEKDDKYFDLAYNRINEYIKNGVRRERKLF